MRRLEHAAVAGLAGYAIGRLVSFDTVSRPLMNRVLRLLFTADVPPDLFDGSPHEVELLAAVKRILAEDAERGSFDMRAMWDAGWAKERHAFGKWAAEMLTCPTCASFHATYLVRLAAGSWRVWQPGWWVDQFAAWGVAQTLVRLPFNSSGLPTEGDWVRRAVERVGVER
jgi:hypothetical protein